MLIKGQDIPPWDWRPVAGYAKKFTPTRSRFTIGTRSMAAGVSSIWSTRPLDRPLQASARRRRHLNRKLYNANQKYVSQASSLSETSFPNRQPPYHGRQRPASGGVNAGSSPKAFDMATKLPRGLFENSPLNGYAHCPQYRSPVRNVMGTDVSLTHKKEIHGSIIFLTALHRFIALPVRLRFNVPRIFLCAGPVERSKASFPQEQTKDAKCSVSVIG
jgi:hypothetical protein